MDKGMFERELERLKGLFVEGDERRVALLEGAIVENARLRCQIDELNGVIAECGMIKVHPKNPLMQKELPVVKELTRLRASYIASCKLLCRELGGDGDEFEDDLGDFE